MLAFTITVSSVLLLIAVMWRPSDAINALMKGVLFGLSLWGLVLIFIQMGYIVKA